ncbi:MAG TPA: pyridoxamine 5'-phosphate oxidase family protein [Acidimicrobiales bacterium]|jgi:nitroimidazol reductase NimA-like FMN-containing flavoprotein (pyridoxamine 5'-phosphate oxidase superfamily)
MRQVDARTGIQVMDRDECLALLTGEHVGRLAVVHGDSPMIYPVNYVLDGDDIVFRSDPGTKVEAGLRGPVCFEVDHLDPSTHGGWSVVVPGRVEEVIPHRHSAWPRILALPLEAWTGPKQRLFRIVADRITGRRVGPSG